MTFLRLSLITLGFQLLTNALNSDYALGQETERSGIEKRIPWTTSRIKGSPEPPLPFVSERAFPKLKFNQCLDISSAPKTERLFVAEQSGKIFSFPVNDDVKAADLCVDLRQINGVENVYAITFHPDFASNRYCYICYIKAAGLEDGTHIARFTVSTMDPPTIDLASETTIITWLSGGHNGCCLKFGPDGYLYISTGDGEGPNPPDIRKTGQDVTDLLSSILRIDVDRSDDGKNYRIPEDNPFIGHRNVRPEIWAYGLRNPWRMSFDKTTGDLWVGDVGWELWELMDRVERGGNYGWAVTEGNQSTNPEWPRGPTPILPPTITHPHSESSSITDGLTYYGGRLQKLHGHHVYGDYDTGKLWAFRFASGQVMDHREIADTTHRIVGFGDDHLDEMYFLDHIVGTINRLIPNPQKEQATDFPRRLSDTGLFDSVTDQLPAPGVIPYSINAEPWHDHAAADRFVAIPDNLTIDTSREKWEFPKDSVLVKTLSLDMKHGEPPTRRHIETQILHFDGLDWQPYTYEWNAAQTDAVLLDASGAERTFDVADPLAPGGTRKQSWRFSGRAECQRCHNNWSGPALAFNAAQLNKMHDYGSAIAFQLATFAHLELIRTLPKKETALNLANPFDTSLDLNSRARAYLHTNCAHCHRMHAGSSVLSKMQYDLPLHKTDMVGVRPTQGTFGIHTAEVVSPSNPFRSVLFYRMSKLGGGRMPHIGSSEIDRAGVELIHDWINQMPQEGEDKDPVAFQIHAQQLAAIELLESADRGGQTDQLVDALLSSTSGALMLQWAVDRKTISEPITTRVVAKAAQHNEVSVRDLFERYLPPEKRVQRLGSVVRQDDILAMSGDTNRGKQVFFNTSGIQCKNCHRIQDEGQELGPDLSEIGKKLTRVQLLESMLEPSKIIDPKYVTYMAETADGQIFTGVLSSQNDNEIVLKDNQNKQIRIPTADVEQLVPQQKSLMPDLLLRDMTAQQVADLLAYLSGLK